MSRDWQCPGCFNNFEWDNRRDHARSCEKHEKWLMWLRTYDSEWSLFPSDEEIKQTVLMTQRIFYETT